MTAYDETITRLAARAGRAETEAGGLRDEVELLRAALDGAARRISDLIGAAENRRAFDVERDTVRRAFAEQALAEERTARIRAEALADLRREDIAELRKETGR